MACVIVAVFAPFFPDLRQVLHTNERKTTTMCKNQTIGLADVYFFHLFSLPQQISAKVNVLHILQWCERVHTNLKFRFANEWKWKYGIEWRSSAVKCAWLKFMGFSWAAIKHSAASKALQMTHDCWLHTLVANLMLYNNKVQFELSYSPIVATSALTLCDMDESGGRMQQVSMVK